MAILCPDCRMLDLGAQMVHQSHIPVEMHRSAGDFDPTTDKITMMTLTVGKGLE